MSFLFSQRLAAAAAAAGPLRWKGREGVVVILGATGTGKSKLSIDVSRRFAGEVVNADKIQVYRGLDVTTNKLPLHDRRGVPHHLLGDLDPAAGELPPSGFRCLAAAAVAEICERGRLPLIAGGSNSYIGALMECSRYRSCLLWVDVDKEALDEHLDRRVDEMVAQGMVDELELYFAEAGDACERHPGLAKAIGVHELGGYFRRRTAAAYDEAIRDIKENTRQLADVQFSKIERMREAGWPVQRLDATAAVRARLRGEGERDAAAAWERDVLGPGVRAVDRFLKDELGRSWI
nr:adenylate dimethylallyltransferase [Gastrodia elata]